MSAHAKREKERRARLTAVPVDHGGRLNEAAVDGVVRDESHGRVKQVIAVRADVLDLDGGGCPNRVAVDLPEDVKATSGRLEARCVNDATVVEVADEGRAVGSEGACGVRCGRNTDTVVIRRAAGTVRGVCTRKVEVSAKLTLESVQLGDRFLSA